MVINNANKLFFLSVGIVHKGQMYLNETVISNWTLNDEDTEQGYLIEEVEVEVEDSDPETVNFGAEDNVIKTVKIDGGRMMQLNVQVAK